MKGSWVLALVALASPAVAHAQVQSTCPSDAPSDGVTDLANAVNQANSTTFVNGQSSVSTSNLDFYDTPFTNNGSDSAPISTTYDVKSAHETDGTSGVVPTSSWTPAEQKQIQDAESQLPPCLVAKADIKQQFRVQRGVKSAQSGILGTAYAYASQVAGGQIFFTDLMFDGESYPGLSAAKQMQAGLGYRDCYPPSGGPNDASNVAARVAAMPAELQSLSVTRILFHEYIHGITHVQEGDDYSNANSTEGFFEKPSSNCPACGASRFGSLQSTLFAPGQATPQSKTIAALQQQMANIPASDPNARARYCALYDQLADYMASQGVPQRWPGDLHSMDDSDEYITIFIENAFWNPAYTFGPKSPYSPAEQAWVKGWWQSTFGAPLGQCPGVVAQH